ncbi:MAG TPA: hypothetical protein VFL64_17175 [Rhizobacter sp.]|nr:hypothetical protein [Rhizobacter sp.]
MNRRTRLSLALSVVVAVAAACGSMAPKNPMTFFVTSAGNGQGANFGGLAGADKHCQSLAEAVGAGQRSWRAYLSTNATTAAPAVNARDRIGSGPWQNAKGDVIATSVADLHSPNNKLTKQTALTEKGAVINGRGDTPNQHDVLTGSTADGLAAPQTCNNWTTSGEGAAIVGHHDRTGLDESAPAKSWNASHATRGCGQDDLVKTGGAGLLYCFAVN